MNRLSKNEVSHDASFRDWMKFAVGLLLLLLFAFGFIPWLQSFEKAGEMKDFILENDIDATGLVYTDVEAFSDADISIRNSMKYAPVGP